MSSKIEARFRDTLTEFSGAEHRCECGPLKLDKNLRTRTMGLASVTTVLLFKYIKVEMISLI